MVWIPVFGIGFLWRADEQFLRLVTPTGEMVPTVDEERLQRRAAEERAERESNRAEWEANRAEEETARRVAAEAQTAELVAELERLRRALDEAQAPKGEEEHR